ncbi:MAG TPA: hypothetical protein VEG39_10930 [Clostridia bacterium]|nr:hypothetical protein [Clostridia bacterium]
MKNYYAKCGKVAFVKSSSAAVTRFEEINEHCEGCPYIQHGSTYRGGKQVPITFCQAGSKKPNHKTEYRTSSEVNTTSLDILSLDMNIFKTISDFAEILPGCMSRGYFNGLDLADCRKSLVFSFESNKKGKAAKKAIIEKFFPAEEDNTAKDRELLSKIIGKEIRTHYNTGGIVTNVSGPHNSYGPGSWSINYTQDGKKSKNPSIINSIKIENGIITCEGKPLQIIDQVEKNCRTCANSEMFKTVNHAGSAGNCHKNGGNYPIYVPDSKCKDFKSKELLDPNDNDPESGLCAAFVDKADARRYVDTKTGRLIFVRSGIGGDIFKAMYQDAGKWGSGSAHGVKSPELKWKNTQEEAQADMDKYAVKKGWKVACEMHMGCGPAESIKCRINRNGWCNLDTASFEDMDAEAANCGFIRVNDRYLMQKYGVPYEEFRCDHCNAFNYTHACHGICALKNEKRYEGCHACGDFTKKETSESCETEEFQVSSGNGLCVNGSTTENAISTVDSETVTTVLGSSDEKEVNQVKCTKHRCPFNDDLNSECGFNPMTDDAHRPQMEEARDEYHCTNKELLGVLEKLQKSTDYNSRIPVSKRIEEALRCPSRDELCGYYCKHNEGCSLLMIKKSDTLVSLMNLVGPHDCDAYRLVNTRYLAKNESEKVVTEMVKSEDRYTEDPVSAAAFDYSTVDTDTAVFLQDKEQKITQIRMMSVMAIGKELKEVHDKLANHYQGSFGKWCESIGISRMTADRYIKAYDYVVTNCDNIEAAENIQPSLLFAISKPSAPKELQDKVLSGDITSHKQYKELEEQLKEARKFQKEIAHEAMSNVNNALERARNAEKKAEATERALKQSQDQHKSKNDLHKSEVDYLERQISQLRNDLKAAKASGSDPAVEDLQKQLREALDQVEKLQEEVKQPVQIPAAAVIEKVPEEVEKELDSLREKAILQDYEKVGNAINGILEIEDEEIQNWVHKNTTGDSRNWWEIEMESLQELSKKISFMMECLENQANQNK